jgi:hypothetical protein
LEFRLAQHRPVIDTSSLTKVLFQSIGIFITEPLKALVITRPKRLDKPVSVTVFFVSNCDYVFKKALTNSVTFLNRVTIDWSTAPLVP